MIINILTLGCSKNTYDSEILGTYLNNVLGHIVQYVETPFKPADALIINTCGFILPAKEESIEIILDAIEAKNQGYISNLYVMGCLVQRYREELPDELPEVDAFFGVDDLPKILKIFGGDYRFSLVGERLLSTPKHYAYLKIAEGCDRKCAFCAIPLIRGKHRSQPIEAIIDQAKALYNQGVKELIIISQDTTYYGIDIYGKPMLHVLLDKLAQIGFPWIRLHYTYPTAYIQTVVDTIAQFPNICNYIDIPFQHISDNVLKMMRRGYNSNFVYKTIEYIRKKLPNSAIRTTLIVGHPGESDKDFQQLIDFVQQVQFERLGVFQYYHEENTYAGENYSDSIPQNIKQQRMDYIMQIQQNIAQTLNQKLIGSKQQVLIDKKEDNYYIGRTQFDSPEIDQEVIVYSKEKLNIGQFYTVKITQAFEFDLVAELNQPNSKPA